MKIKVFYSLILACLIFPYKSFALSDILVQQLGYISNTVHIPAGHYSSPYIAATTGTEYILDGDITADGTAIAVRASRVHINLNGHTITYNQTQRGEGVFVDVYNKTDIAISNGTIIQHNSYDSTMPTTTLAESIDATQTTIQVTDSTGFVVGSVCIIENEGVTVTAVDGNTLTVTRARLSTSGVAHDLGTTIYVSKAEGDVYGTGNNPIRTYPYLVTRLQIADIHAIYGGRDVGGFDLKGNYALVENNILEDTYEYGTVKNRHQGIDAIEAVGDYGVVRNNTIINTRHRGVRVANYGDVYSNTIGIRSICTNSAGVFVYNIHNTQVHNNTITGRGEHPIGVIAHGGSHDIDIYDNAIDVQTTRLGWEYGSDPNCFNPATPCGDRAVGLRSTNGATDIRAYNNTILVNTNAFYAGTYSPTGEAVTVRGGGRGIMAALADETQNAIFHHNTITMIDADGTGEAPGLACCGLNAGTNASRNLTFAHNTVTSNVLNVAVSDSYGPCEGHPLFIKNTFIKSGAFATYKTLSASYDGYFEGTARFVSNSYANGASESNYDFNFEALTNETRDKNKSIIFGRWMEVTATNNSVPQSNKNVLVYRNDAGVDWSGVTDAGGVSGIIVQDYELHNNGGTTGSATPIRVDYKPHTIAVSDLFTTLADNTDTAWDNLTSSGVYPLASGNMLISVNTEGGDYVPPSEAVDTTPPVISNTAPSGTLAFGTISTILSLTTDEAATCRVSQSSGTGYDSATNLTTTGGTSHSMTVSGLVDGGSYARYVWCRDAANNTSNYTTISWSVATAAPVAVRPFGKVVAQGEFQFR